MKKVTRKSLKKRLIQIVVVGIVLSFLTLLTPLYAQSEPIVYVAHAEDVDQLQTKQQIKDYVLSEAVKARVDVHKIDYIVEHESHYDPKAIGDLNVVCSNKKSPYYGKETYARGLWQITRCWYPDITDEQAHDVKWSTEWALNVIGNSRKDCITQWSTCRAWYGE